MPDYKKKKVTRFGFDSKKPKKRRGKSQEENITMTPSKGRYSTKKQSNLKVVKGNKKARRRRSRGFWGAAAVITVVAVVASAVLPVGLAENLTNAICKIGSGGFPAELSGGELISADARSGVFYTLTDTSLLAFSNGGKRIFDIPHGYSNPVLKTSETRALIFDQGGNKLAVYNLHREISSISDEKYGIITAAISRNGSYAVASRAESYASTVRVYDNNGKQIYEWNSAKGMVNSIAISPSGKKIAVSTIGAEDGHSSSKVRVFSFDSADSIASFDFSNEFIYSLENVGKGFCILTKQGCDYVDWSKQAKTDIKSELELNMFRRAGKGALFVFNRSSDKSDNTVRLISKKGEQVSEFSLDLSISDIEYANGHIYCISDDNILRYSKTGELLQKGKCEYGAKRLAVLSKDKVAVIGDNTVSTVTLAEEEE